MENVYSENVKIRKQWKSLRYVLKLVYPKANSYMLIIYIFIKYVVKMYNPEKDKGYELRTLPDELYFQLIQSIQPNNPLNDSSHCVFVSQNLFDELYSENFFYRDRSSLWIAVKLHPINHRDTEPSSGRKVGVIKKFLSIESPKPSNQHELPKQFDQIFRTVQILPIVGISDSVIYSNETEYFNACNHFCIVRSGNPINLRFVPIPKQSDAPKIAQKLVIQMINASLPVGTDLTNVLLNNYFRRAKFLHKNDYFGIPLTGKYMANMYVKYSNVASECEKLYFKCIEIESDDDGSSDAGYFVMKGKTDLIQDQNMNSFIPRQYYITCSYNIEGVGLCENLENCFIPCCPYGFESLISDMESAIRPFILNSDIANPLHDSVKCVLQPVFLIRGAIGAGAPDLVQSLSKKHGLNFFSTSCRQLMASTPKQSESKVDALLQKAKNVAPVLVLLEEFETFGLDIENKEEGRIIDSFKNQLKNLFENFTKLPIIIFASCSDTYEMKNSLSRIFLEQFEISGFTKQQRQSSLQWLLEYKNITICDIKFSPFQTEPTKTESKIDNSVKEEQESRMKAIMRKGKRSVNKNVKAKNSKNYEDDDVLKMVAIEQSLQSGSIPKTEIIRSENEEEINLLSNVSSYNYSNHKRKQLDESVAKVLENAASKTETFSFKDLDTLTNITLKHAYHAQLSHFDNSEDVKFGLVREVDFYDSIEKMRLIQSQKLNAVKIPNVNWEDIGGLKELKKEIFKTIELPLKYPQLLMNNSLKRSGLLLWGPPGCGKTLVARAIASQLQASFLSIKGPELLDMYVGQSEKNMRDMFANARASAPCVIFLDEAEAAAGARGASGDSAGAADRLVSQLLAELDGVASRQNEADTGPVIVVAATNRPDLVEPALLRPGRLDKLLFVGPYEGETDKLRVLEASCRNFNLSSDVNLKDVVNRLPYKCTGADLASVVNKARNIALVRAVNRAESGEVNPSDLNEDHISIQDSDFENVIEDFIPSLTVSELNYYESLRGKLS